jgi:hypothetical protein
VDRLLQLGSSAEVTSPEPDLVWSSGESGGTGRCIFLDHPDSITRDAAVLQADDDKSNHVQFRSGPHTFNAKIRMTSREIPAGDELSRQVMISISQPIFWPMPVAATDLTWRAARVPKP